MNKLLIICGPTATGKTDLGICMAKKLNGEIISVDSRQVYKGLDLITGKDLPGNSKLKTQSSKLGITNNKFSVGYRKKSGIPVWLVDIVDTHYRFNVGDYSKLANKVIVDILNRGKLPIIVGGTGMYIRSVIAPYQTQYIPPNDVLRKELEKLDIFSLQKKLEQIEVIRFQNMNNSDRLNPRRLVRAIEISQFKHSGPMRTKKYAYDYLMIGLKSDFNTLYKRIDKRVEERISNGALIELKTMISKKTIDDESIVSSTGVDVLMEYLNGTRSLVDAIRKWKFEEHAYARRQMTWFKKDPFVRWFDISDTSYRNKIEELVHAWYTEENSNAAQN